MTGYSNLFFLIFAEPWQQQQQCTQQHNHQPEHQQLTAATESVAMGYGD
jgi:hypothetical protein